MVRGQGRDAIRRRLSERARAGINVRVLMDCLGGSKASEAGARAVEAERREARDLLQAALVELRPVQPPDLTASYSSSMARIGYAFGHGIADQWLGNGTDAEHWRDTGVRLEGPVVHGLQSVFAQNWVEETHCLPAVDDLLPGFWNPREKFRPTSSAAPRLMPSRRSPCCIPWRIAHVRGFKSLIQIPTSRQPAVSSSCSR